MRNITTLSENEKNILYSMIGKNFCKFKHDPFQYSNMVFGIIGIYVENKAYRLTSLLDRTTRFVAEDDIAVFRLNEAEDSEIKTFMDGGELIETPVNDTIKSIDIVIDHQSISNNTENFSLDTVIGLVFHLESKKEIAFEIGTWFSEMITVTTGEKLLEQFTPIEEFFEEWEDNELYIPSCTREVITLI